VFVATAGLLFEQALVPSVNVTISVAAKNDPTMAATLAWPCRLFGCFLLSGSGLVVPGMGFAVCLLFEFPCKLSWVKLDIMASWLDPPVIVDNAEGWPYRSY
jgi:hypothetical protein